MFLADKEELILPARLKEYDESRHIAHKQHLCHAPFNNMYFNIHGQVAPCWLTLADADNIKDKSIREIWNGHRFKSIRSAIKQNNLAFACGTCQHNISCGNYVSALAKLYDLPYALTDYPAEMEFELSNICNLECVMCKGDLSSAIRKNREHLPAIESPYNDSFVEQLKEFLPHLKEVKFLGGEPFLVPLYYKIWDAIIAINPAIKITITTNGTVWNSRVKEILEALHCNIIISIDGFNKPAYESIRLGSNFDKVIENFEHFRAYTAQKQTYMGVSVNPLRKNRHELADYVTFCNQKNVSLWFNTVVYPYREAIWTLPAATLEHLYQQLATATLPERPANCTQQVYDNNTRNFNNLVEVQIKTWWQQAVSRQQQLAQDLATLSGEELANNLTRRLQDYINSDAYLPQHEKEKTLLLLAQKLPAACLNKNNTDRLYILHEEDCIDFLKTMAVDV
jgi:radical SAM protein with 4Fe4S-binding SPASM domain